MKTVSFIRCFWGGGIGKWRTADREVKIGEKEEWKRRRNEVEIEHHMTIHPTLLMLPSSSSK